MPDHAHWLLRLGDDDCLSAAVNRLKSASARSSNRAAGCGGQRLWQHGFHDHALRQESQLLQAARYIVLNPVRAGLVTNMRDYPYWNCAFL